MQLLFAVGGGGIPVVYKDNFFYGVPSVIDKDLLSSLLAIEMSVDALIISTAVDSVKTNFGTDKEKSHDYMTLDDAKNIDNGEFPAGSMGPKVEAICLALESIEGLKAIICQARAGNKRIAWRHRNHICKLSFYHHFPIRIKLNTTCLSSARACSLVR